jgi:hypothetical protein
MGNKAMLVSVWLGFRRVTFEARLPGFYHNAFILTLKTSALLSALFYRAGILAESAKISRQ